MFRDLKELDSRIVSLSSGSREHPSLTQQHPCSALAMAVGRTALRMPLEIFCQLLLPGAIAPFPASSAFLSSPVTPALLLKPPTHQAPPSACRDSWPPFMTSGPAFPLMMRSSFSALLSPPSPKVTERLVTSQLLACPLQLCGPGAVIHRRGPHSPPSMGEKPLSPQCSHS